MKILVTGAAGFIGFHLCKKLIKSDYKVIGLDNLNSYYDISLKKERINQLKKLCELRRNNFKLIKGSLEDNNLISSIFSNNDLDFVFHLGAQAGVRYSLENPHAYINSNIKGFLNILEGCKKNKPKSLIFASSSSVYGGNEKIPFSENHSVDHPVSLYAATKKSNELMAHAYSHLYNLPCTGLRFFTVYGPWGRPDMAPMIFTKSIIEKTPLRIFNNGDMARDFTYIDDVIEIMFRLLKKPVDKNVLFDKKNPESSTSWSPYKIFNIGNSKSVRLIDFITTLENEIGEKAIKVFEPMQSGDVKFTSADTSLIEAWIGFKPNTELKVGIKKFVKWYKNFYQH
tara:strand:- start:223 stop:1245 length:1023 start_codon:yes stop_codon:yes gene_type:complete